MLDDALRVLTVRALNSRRELLQVEPLGAAVTTMASCSGWATGKWSDAGRHSGGETSVPPTLGAFVMVDIHGRLANVGCSHPNCRLWQWLWQWLLERLRLLLRCCWRWLIRLRVCLLLFD